jgi:hypothetical protein
VQRAFDKVLVAADPGEVEKEVRAAVAAAADGPRHGRPLAAAVRDGLRALADRPEGHAQWAAPSARSAVAAAWWRDFAGRLHVRVVGARLAPGAGGPPAFFGPAPLPPLALIHPERALARPDGVEVLCLCACGAWGEARSLGWMGDRCGPCFDRGDQAPCPPFAGMSVGPDARAVAIDPGGAVLGALDSFGVLRTWDLATGRPHGWARTEANAPSFALGPDGRVAALVCPGFHGSLALWEVGGGGRLLSRFTIDTQSFVFLPDGAVLAQRHGAPVLFDPAQPDSPRPVSALRAGAGCELTASRDGRRLGAASLSPRSLVWCDDAGGAAVDLPGEVQSPPAFAPDGALCVVIQQAGAAVLFEGPPGVGRPLPWFADEALVRLNFSPGGCLAGCGGALARFWARAGEGWRVLLEGRAEGLASVEWLPDGRLLTFSRRDGAVKLWPAELFR